MAATSKNKELFEDYEGFVEKFKPKKTTDDCYTPAIVYEAILGWVCDEYNINRDDVVRPFWPGGDYEGFDYTDAVVVDNPPFSMISKICKFYEERGIKYFLFAPFLVNLNILYASCHILSDCSITYANGAVVPTSFVTNLEDEYLIRSAPDLYEIIKAADEKSRNEVKQTKSLPKYTYPDNVLTAAMVGRFSKYGVDFRVRKDECAITRALDAQKAMKKAIFGCGYLLSHEAAAEKAAAEKAAAEKAAAEKAAAIVWPLSPRELEIIKGLGRKRASVA